MIAFPAPLADLARLSGARSTAADYYAPLLESSDEIMRIGAWCAVLDREAVRVDQYARVLELCAHGAIQARAFAFFEGNWDHELAAEAAAIVASSEAEADRLARTAALRCDDVLAAEAQRHRFLATGRFDALLSLIDKAEEAGGWREALPIAVTMLVLTPHEPLAAERLLRLLYGARDVSLMRSVLDGLRTAGLQPYVVAFYEAAAKLVEGDAAACRKLLQTVDAMRPPRADVVHRVRPLALRLNAEALDRLGEFKAAYKAYADAKSGEQTGPPADDYYRVILAAAAQDIPALPPDPNTSDFIMTGFPRSGTTLLETALSAHPRLETFEEIPAVSSMQLLLDRELALAGSKDEAVAVCLRARERYYDEERRRRRKTGADIFIDKMPMRSSEAQLLAKMFPDKRFLFSIRHPFDVVLSCFKQQFSRNIAMQQFDTFEGAARLYDFSMTQWFSVHGLDDPKVHYLRYDELVTRFELTMRAILDFLGAGWDPAVLEFAQIAGQRFARTPSYQKVRQGLALGVQSSWKNYGFLFETAAAKPLTRWAEFFGYSVA